MTKRNINQEKIISSFLLCATTKGASASSLQDIADKLEIQKASLYNHFKSKDEIYDMSLEYCRDNLDSVKFFKKDLIQDNIFIEQQLDFIFREVIKSYINIYEESPIIEMYTFISTEKYFNSKAALYAQEEFNKIKNGILDILNKYIEIFHGTNINKEFMEQYAINFTSALMMQIDYYLINKKEIVRQNPDTGNDSLFELPVNNQKIKDILNMSDYFVGYLFKS